MSTANRPRGLCVRHLSHRGSWRVVRGLLPSALWSINHQLSTLRNDRGTPDCRLRNLAFRSAAGQRRIPHSALGGRGPLGTPSGTDKDCKISRVYRPWDGGTGGTDCRGKKNQTVNAVGPRSIVLSPLVPWSLGPLVPWSMVHGSWSRSLTLWHAVARLWHTCKRKNPR